MPLTPIEQNDLLEIFCRHSSESLKGPAAKLELLHIMKAANWEVLTNNATFNACYAKLEEMLLSIEHILSFPATATQLKRALQSLSEKRDKVEQDEFKAYITMMKKKLWPNWDQPAIVSFTKGLQLLSQWIHFFISYTNQSAPGINRTYKKIISNDLPQQVIRQYEQERNLMGRLIDRYVRMQRASSFYDKDDIAWSDEWEEKITDFTQSSYAFIQIIETEMFEHDPPENICYTEYETYKQSIQQLSTAHALEDIKPKFFFLVSNPDKQEKFRFEPLGRSLTSAVEEWVNLIYRVQYATLYRNLSNSQLKQKIQEAALECKEYKKALLNKYIESIN